MLAGCGGSGGGGGPKVTLTGSLVLHSADSGGGDNTIKTGAACAGTGGYNDLAVGGAVTVADATGKTIGVGALNEGAVTNDQDYSAGGITVSVYDCVWKFALPSLPSTAFYKVTVTHRGTMTYPLRQVQAGPVALTIG